MLDYGEIAYAHTSPFQADMLPGEILQVILFLLGRSRMLHCMP